MIANAPHRGDNAIQVFLSSNSTVLEYTLALFLFVATRQFLASRERPVNPDERVLNAAWVPLDVRFLVKPQVALFLQRVVKVQSLILRCPVHLHQYLVQHGQFHGGPVPVGVPFAALAVNLKYVDHVKVSVTQELHGVAQRVELADEFFVFIDFSVGVGADFAFRRPSPHIDLGSSTRSMSPTCGNKPSSVLTDSSRPRSSEVEDVYLAHALSDYRFQAELEVEVAAAPHRIDNAPRVTRIFILSGFGEGFYPVGITDPLCPISVHRYANSSFELAREIRFIVVLIPSLVRRPAVCPRPVLSCIYFGKAFVPLTLGVERPRLVGISVIHVLQKDLFVSLPVRLRDVVEEAEAFVPRERVRIAAAAAADVAAAVAAFSNEDVRLFGDLHDPLPRILVMAAEVAAVVDGRQERERREGGQVALGGHPRGRPRPGNRRRSARVQARDAAVVHHIVEALVKDPGP
eukprot:CAMPEP_0172532260 /NCGR_PEP_ID=MMETSP1067-20121228/5378_1 /TAXON_ID=265564 ORGANISM="Thalassiosira punctigera, Strain Tpunct2005C2" /NCGR_SAMPLE_ID=MMETSP1067 /ASSEMBLY_ACC=CAM_ASM_000444 /LENGTH=460 /DNA_ID=CAMNT_0013316757 /DNA_START=469 /DNA_END=1854 /DNA_ORIENTATION=-